MDEVIQTHMIHSIKEIKKNYSTYLIDMVGVIYDGKNSFDHAINAINRLLQHNKQIIFLSNNPRPHLFAENKLKTFGINGTYTVVTSGDFLHYTLATTLVDKNIYHLGRNRQHALLENTNARLTSHLPDADAIILSCYIEGDENHEAFNTDLENIIASGKPVYCPNPDRLALEGNIVRYPSGYFAHKLEQLGGSVIYLGKPYKTFYDFIQQKYPEITFNKQKTLMIGDTLETDICGAINYGIDSLLVLNGITGLLSKKNPSILAQSPYQPTYILQELRW